MNAYNLTLTTLPYPLCNEAKEKRRKVLEEVRARRKIIYARYRKKLRVSSQQRSFPFLLEFLELLKKNG